MTEDDRPSPVTRPPFMWHIGWRDTVWAQMQQPFDLVIIGGGITGAGILREAASAGWRALLVEAHDFASGTSSRSSKLVHGGLRYLKHGEIKLTFESVRERERLLHEGRGLVSSLGFLLPSFAGDRPPAWVFGLGLSVYDVLALQWSHRHYDALDMRDLCPSLRAEGLLGGYRYFDAQTDDARLVLRVIREAVREGAWALNYARADGLLRTRAGRVCGVAVRDRETGRTAEVSSAVVINATGAWADDVRAFIHQPRRLRRLRGSHLIFSAARLPLRRAVSFLHPADQRPVFALPWEGVTLFGTTDVDHRPDLTIDVALDSAEADYLLRGVQYAFPGLALTAADVRATLSGVRAVLDTGQSDPSQESREHILWQENGLLTVTGGKLTTFRLMARSALTAIRARLPAVQRAPEERMLTAPPEFTAALDPATRLRLAGRYGIDALEISNTAQADELTPIADAPALWAELRWAARAEGVVHLDDLLLRRVRLGLLLPQGGWNELARIRAIVQSELRWDEARWASEATAYGALWQRCHAWPG